MIINSANKLFNITKLSHTVKSMRPASFQGHIPSSVDTFTKESGDTANKGIKGFFDNILQAIKPKSQEKLSQVNTEPANALNTSSKASEDIINNEVSSQIKDLDKYFANPAREKYTAEPVDFNLCYMTDLDRVQDCKQHIFTYGINYASGISGGHCTELIDGLFEKVANPENVMISQKGGKKPLMEVLHNVEENLLKKKAKICKDTAIKINNEAHLSVKVDSVKVASVSEEGVTFSAQRFDGKDILKDVTISIDKNGTLQLIQNEQSLYKSENNKDYQKLFNKALGNSKDLTENEASIKNPRTSKEFLNEISSGFHGKRPEVTSANIDEAGNLVLGFKKGGTLKFGDGDGEREFHNCKDLTLTLKRHKYDNFTEYRQTFKFNTLINGKYEPEEIEVGPKTCIPTADLQEAFGVFERYQKEHINMPAYEVPSRKPEKKTNDYIFKYKDHYYLMGCSESKTVGDELPRVSINTLYPIRESKLVSDGCILENIPDLTEHSLAA